MAEKWDVYDAPDREEKRPEDRAAAGDPLPSAIQEVGTGGVRFRRRTLAVAAVVIAALVATPVALLVRHESGSGDHEPLISFAPTLVPTRYQAFVAALKKRTGSTRVYSFKAFDGDYSVDVPAATKGGIPQSFFYYGDSGLRSSGDAGSYVVGRTFDLATLDIGALEGLYERAWDEAGGKVTGTSLSVTPPKESGDSWVTIYVDHPDDTFFAVEGDLDGTQLDAHLVD